jgi:copper chaperone NosL
MGGDEAVPFGQELAARQFAETNGGQVVAFDAVPEDYILGDTEHSGH